MPYGCPKIAWMVLLIAATLALPYAAKAQAVCGQMVGSSLICTDPSNPSTSGCYYNMLDTGSYSCTTTCPAPKLLAYLAATASNFVGRYCLSTCPAGLTSVTREPQPTCMTGTDFAAYQAVVDACSTTVVNAYDQIKSANATAAAKEPKDCTPGPGHCIPKNPIPGHAAWKTAIDTAKRAEDTFKAGLTLGADRKVSRAQCDAHLSTLSNDLANVVALYAAGPG